MDLNCLPDIKLQSSNGLSGTLFLHFWPKKLLLSIEISIGIKLSHNGIGMKGIEDWNCSNVSYLRECNGLSVPCFVRREHWLQRVKRGKVRKICQILSWFFQCFLAWLRREISCDQHGWLNLCHIQAATIAVKIEQCRWSISIGFR